MYKLLSMKLISCRHPALARDTGTRGVARLSSGCLCSLLLDVARLEGTLNTMSAATVSKETAHNTSTLNHECYKR
jgi:hypothetical protein